MASKTLIGIGCKVFDADHWRKFYKWIAADEHSVDIIAEYKLYFNLAVKLYDLGGPIDDDE